MLQAEKNMRLNISNNPVSLLSLVTKLILNAICYMHFQLQQVN